MVRKLPIDKVICGDALEVLRTLPDESVHCCVTSPPYWGLRDYGVDGQIGLEPTPEEYVTRLVEVFREVRRVLRKDGTAWLNLGDCYASPGKGGPWDEGRTQRNTGRKLYSRQANRGRYSGFKPKDLIGIPWRVAFALQADGWWLRSDIIWYKPNSLPESVRDRPTKAHEYIFLLAKSRRYYYDQDAIREPFTDKAVGWLKTGAGKTCYGLDGVAVPGNERKPSSTLGGRPNPKGRNKRTVWIVPTCPFKGAHFAVFPPDLIRPCILAGCPPGGIVLDPFFGSGTVGVVALQEGRHFIGIELNPEYCVMARKRIQREVPVYPLFSQRLPIIDMECNREGSLQGGVSRRG